MQQNNNETTNNKGRNEGRNENSRNERRHEGNKTLGQTIRYYRHLRGLTQEQLAERADINDKLISFYETDSRTPPIFNLISIAAALGVSLDELCGLHNDEPETELEREIMRVIKDVLRRYIVQRVDK